MLSVSVGIVRLRTKATEFLCFVVSLLAVFPHLIFVTRLMTSPSSVCLPICSLSRPRRLKGKYAISSSQNSYLTIAVVLIVKPITPAIRIYLYGCIFISVSSGTRELCAIWVSYIGEMWRSVAYRMSCISEVFTYLQISSEKTVICYHTTRHSHLRKEVHTYVLRTISKPSVFICKINEPLERSGRNYEWEEK
jgi:hypothetical protein